MGPVYCSNCRAEVGTAARFCVNCGRALTGTPQARPMAKRSHKPRRIGVALALSIALLPYLFAWLTLRRGHTGLARAVSFAWMFAVVAMSVVGVLNGDPAVSEPPSFPSARDLPVVAPLDDLEKPWLVASTFDDGCRWRYFRSPESGIAYIIQRGVNTRRYRTSDETRRWPEEVVGQEPANVSLTMYCDRGGRGIWLKTTGVGHRHPVLPKGNLVFALNNDGPISRDGSTPKGAPQGIVVPTTWRSDHPRTLIPSPTDQLIRGFYDAWSMGTMFALDDDTFLSTTFDLKHSSAHSADIGRWCAEF